MRSRYPRGADPKRTASSAFAVARREEDGGNLLLRRIAVPNHDVDEGGDAGGDRNREDHGEAAEQDPDRGDGDEDDQRGQPNGVTENTRHDEIVLEQPN